MALYEVVVSGRMYVSAESEEEALEEAAEKFSKVYESSATEMGT